MGSALDQIVNINILAQTRAVPQPGFGIPLAVGPSNRMGSDLIRYYTDPADMLTDGFLNSDPEYIRAIEFMEQDLQPEQFGIGANTASVAQVDTVTPIAASSAWHYVVTIDGVDYDFLSDGSPTATEVVTGLKALINADADAPCAATGTATLILTANHPGVGFTTSINSSPYMSLAHTTANHSISTDIAAIQAVSDIWYGVAICSNAYGDLLDVATYIETQKKVFFGVTQDAAVPTSSATDIASVLKGKSFKRTALLYSADADSGMEAAWLGGQLPQIPGSNSYKFKTLVGITPDKFTQTQRNYLIGIPGTPGKNCNIYETVGGVPITEEGFMVGGQFIDVTIGLDWLESTMQTNIYALLVQSPKIPYTDAGAAIIQNAIIQTLKQGVANGLIDGATLYTATVPAVLDESSTNRANRVLGGVKFSCRLAGALHFVKITGYVSV